MNASKAVATSFRARSLDLNILTVTRSCEFEFNFSSVRLYM